MPSGGKRKGAGRPVNSRATAQVGEQIRELERARQHGVTDATFDALEQLRNVAKQFLGQAALEQRKSGDPKQKFDPVFFNERLVDARDTLAVIVKYERPTFRAVLFKDAADLLNPLGRGTGSVGANDDNVVDFPTDQVAAARVYQRLIGIPAPAKGSRGRR